MKRTFKKAVSVFLVVAMLLCAAPLNGLVGLDLPQLFDFKAEAASYSGTCGDNLTWTLDDKGVLTISERQLSKEHTTITEVTVWYNKLEGISVDGATVIFEGAVESQLLDIKAKSKASLTLSIDALDTLVECTGKSSISLSGQSRYFKLAISTATMSGFDLKTVAANIDASHDAEVRISVSERLEAITSTSAQIYYKGEPVILRTKNSLFGGEIAAVN